MPMNIVPQKVIRKISTNKFVIQSRKGKRYVVECLRGADPNKILPSTEYYVEYHFSPTYNRKVPYLTDRIYLGDDLVRKYGEVKI